MNSKNKNKNERQNRRLKVVGKPISQMTLAEILEKCPFVFVSQDPIWVDATIAD